MFGGEGKGTSLMEWFLAYVDTNYEIPRRKQQSTYVDELVVQAVTKMRLIHGKDVVSLLDRGFFGLIVLVHFGHLWTINNNLV